MSYKFTRRVGQYIISHWRGEHTLARAFWINDAVLTAILLVAYVLVDGVSLEQELLDNELAYEYSGGKKSSWCE